LNAAIDRLRRDRKADIGTCEGEGENGEGDGAHYNPNNLSDVGLDWFCNGARATVCERPFQGSGSAQDWGRKSAFRGHSSGVF
jgi:hypothetical protein